MPAKTASRSFPAQVHKVIVVLNGKGGVGKTTTAVNIAATLSHSAKVLLVDSDPQASATWWIERGKGQAFDLTQETEPTLLKQLKELQQYQVVVVDTPPALQSETLQASIQAADYVLLPTPPAPMDLSALIETVRRAIAPCGVAHRVLLTRVDPRSLGEAQEAQETLKELGIPACQAFIRAYKAHERAALDGMTITQWHGRHARAAAADYQKVVDEIVQDWRL